MKKNKIWFELILLSSLVFVCAFTGCKKKGNGADTIKVNENAYLCESSSGDILINFDDAGNPVELIDANGEVTDLTKEEVSVIRDEKNGEIKSVTVGKKTIAVKEKADEKNSEKILATAKEKKEKTSEDGKKVTSEEKKEEIKAEKDTEEEVKIPSSEEMRPGKEKFTPGVDAPKLPSDNPKSSEKAKETPSEEVKEEEVAVDYSEEAVSGTMYGAFYATNGSQVIYSKAGTQYPVAKDPKTGGDAYLTGANAVELIGKTNNGWYHIKAYTAFGPAFSERVNGYVPASALVDEATKNKQVEEKNKQQGEERKKQEEKESEIPSEKPSETPSETPSEQPSNPPAPPSKEVMDQIEEEQRKRAEEYNNRQYAITASANRGIFDQINAWRVENGLAELSWGSDNEGIASTRAYEQTDLVTNQHGSINHGYGTPWSGMENLSDRGTSAVFDGWKASGGHNQTMLGSYTYCVVYTGYADGRDGVTVALFW